MTIEPAQKFQTMDGIGACACAFPYASDLGWDWNAVKFVFDELDLQYIRLAPWHSWWEYNNDNADANVINWSGFGVPNNFAAWWEVPFAQYLTGRGIEVDVGVFGLAEWLQPSPSEIDPSMYPELGETIAAYTINMQNNGVPQPICEVKNEPEISGLPTAQALRDAGLAVLTKFNHFGLTDVMLHAPNHHAPGNAASWAQVWLANTTLRGRTEAVSYHTWWSSSFSDYNAIRQVAEQYNKPVWATEIGYCALYDGCWLDGEQHYLRPETWGTAWDYAMSYYRAIRWSRATRAYHWTVVGWDAAVSESGQRYPSFYILKHFANFIRPDAVYINSTTTDGGILSLAFELDDGGYSLVILNTNTTAEQCEVAFDGGDIFSIPEAYTTTEWDYQLSVGPVYPDYNGTVSVDLPAESVTSMFIEPGLAGDIDGDCDADWFDFAKLAGNWHESGAGLDGDINGDEYVDIYDVRQLAAWWLVDCNQQ